MLTLLFQPTSMDSQMDVTTLSETPSWEWPEAAKEIIQKSLIARGDLPEERALAVELAGELVVIDDGLANTLLGLVGDAGESEVIRSRAAIALGPALEEVAMEIGYADDLDDTAISMETYERIQSDFRNLFLDGGTPNEVRRRILEASIRGEREWHADAVRAAFHSDDEGWRMTAVFAMAHVPGFDEEIMLALTDPSAAVRREAVRAAGSRGLTAAGARIASILKNERKDRELLLAAIAAVGGVAPGEAAELLSGVDSDDPEVDDAVAEVRADLEMFEGGDFDFAVEDW
jgi:hypothetical protein